MGLFGSKFKVNRMIDGQGIECLRALKALEFSDRDINKLYSAFNEFDLSHDNKISLFEFLAVLDIGTLSIFSQSLLHAHLLFNSENTIFTAEIFDSIDTNHNKSLNFQEVND
jgi:Ca2+-binding EF-hand superfamily protein